MINNKKAFTLVELLVVISIIALLVSILMPSLGRARDHAKNVLCMSNVRQWGLAGQMYASENNDQIIAETYAGLWVNQIRPFIGLQVETQLDTLENDIAYCPVATKVREINGSPGPGFGLGSRSAWGKYDGSPWNGVGGSYGINWWIYKVTIRDEDEGHNLKLKAWQTFNVRRPYNVPLFLDCYIYGGYPEALWDTPPQSEEDSEYLPGGLTDGNIRYFTVNRHNGFVNTAFADYSVRKVGLKELWTLSWNKKWDDEWAARKDINPIVWPEWMEDFQDFF